MYSTLEVYVYNQSLVFSIFFCSYASFVLFILMYCFYQHSKLSRCLEIYWSDKNGWCIRNRRFFFRNCSLLFLSIGSVSGSTTTTTTRNYSMTRRKDWPTLFRKLVPKKDSRTAEANHNSNPFSCTCSVFNALLRTLLYFHLGFFATLFHRDICIHQ